MSTRARHGIAGVVVLVTVVISIGLIWWDHSGSAAHQNHISTLTGGDTGVVAGAFTVLAGVAGWWSLGGVTRRRRHEAVATTAGGHGGRWPVLGDLVDRESFESLGVRIPRESTRARRPQLPYMGRHLLDERLRQALTLHRFVLVHGPSAAGKSRSTVQAAARLYPNRVVVVPERRPGHLNELLKENAVPQLAVVWLDDLDRHLDREGGALTAEVLQRVMAIDGTRIIATIRAAAYEQYKPQGEIIPAGRDAIEMAEQVDFTGWDDTDRTSAAAQLAVYPNVVAALNKQMGLGEYLSAGPDLIERLESGAPPAEGVALVRAAGDWYRAGMTRPIPESLLRQLYPVYLPDNDRRLLDRYPQGLDWACESVSGAQLLCQRTNGSGVAVHDYVLDHLSAEPSGLPEPTWQILAAGLATEPEDLFTLGIAAYGSHQDTLTAERLLTTAARLGLASAMSSLGVLLKERREVVKAERWYRDAAAGGNARAMCNLGVLLEERGEVMEAERWYRDAAAGGNARAMHNLGALLEERGEVMEAERWYRDAAAGGDAGALGEVTFGQLVAGTGPPSSERRRAARLEAGAHSPRPSRTGPGPARSRPPNANREGQFVGQSQDAQPVTEG